MPRRQRLFVSGGIYHVYCKTHRGEFRFTEPREAQSFTSVVGSVSRSHGLSILAWCLMSNHYHLVIRTADVKLWRSMARIHSFVTMCYNRYRGLLGSGWQSRYRARLILDEDDLRHAIVYVHLNPVMAGIVKDPAEYFLSGHRAIMAHSTPTLVDVQAALQCYEGDTMLQSRSNYLAHLRQVAQSKWASEPVRTLPWWKPVTYDHQTVDQSSAPPEARTFDDMYPDLPATRQETVDELLSRACCMLGSSIEEITGAAKRSDVALARRRFTFIAAHRFGYQLKAIAEVLGKSSSQASRWLRWQTEAYHSDGKEARILDGISAALLQETLESAEHQN